MIRPRWFRRRRVVVALSGLVALAVLAGVVNTVLTRQVRGRVEAALRCATGNESLDPSVSFGSTPLLVDLVSGDIGEVTVGAVPARDVLSTGLLGDGDLTITLHDVGMGSPPSVGSAQASATVGWDSLAGRLGSGEAGEDLSGAEFGAQDDLLSVTLDRQVAGAPLQVLMHLAADGSSITLTPEAMVVGGRRIQASLLSGLAAGRLGGSAGTDPLAARTIDLDLPEGVSLRSARARPEGLAVDLGLSPDRLGGRSGAVRSCTA